MTSSPGSPLDLAPVLPVVKLEDAATAVPLARTLVSCGLPAIEVTLRTRAAADAIRAITADWFLPRSMARLDARLKELAVQSVAAMEERGGRCDFARDIAMPFPLQVILAILGLPESDYPRMLTLTQELFGAADPDLARGEQQTLEDLVAVINDFFVYFTNLTEERRAHPTDDLAGILISAIDGLSFGCGDAVIGVRVPESEEVLGLDSTQHGEIAYQL